MAFSFTYAICARVMFLPVLRPKAFRNIAMRINPSAYIKSRGFDFITRACVIQSRPRLVEIYFINIIRLRPGGVVGGGREKRRFRIFRILILLWFFLVFFFPPTSILILYYVCKAVLYPTVIIIGCRAVLGVSFTRYIDNVKNILCARRRMAIGCDRR